MPATLKAFREDGTEVQPGETIVMTGIEHTFRAAARVSNGAGTDGMIAVDGYPDMYSAPFGLTVRAVPDDEPAWESSMAGEPGEIPSDRSEPDELREALALADMALQGDPNVSDLSALARLAEVVRAQADRTASRISPPVPGVTRNAGCVVYSVLEASSRSWWVAAMRESDGERVTWLAEADDEGGLHYSAGHYHTRGQASGDEALADLADRAGVFGALGRLSSGAAARNVFWASHEHVLTELSGVYGVGKARIRTALLEAAALGQAQVSWHDGQRRQVYGLRYNRVGCVFTWRREY